MIHYAMTSLYNIPSNFSNCPAGFVIPDKYKYDTRVVWVNGTHCAWSCRSFIWTDNEWEKMTLLSLIMSVIGLVLISVMLLTWIMDKELRKQYITIFIGGYGVMVSLFYVVVSIVPYESRLCHSNAIRMDQSDGLSFCTIETVIKTYGALGLCASCLVSSLDLYLKVCRNWRDTSYLKPYYMIALIFIPLIFGIICGTGAYTSPIHFETCGPIGQNNMITYFIPGIILVAGGFIPMILVVSKLIHITFNKNQNTSESTIARMRTFQRPLLFVIAYICAPLCINIASLIQKNDLSGMQIFVDCVFQNYDWESDTSWQSICGLKPVTSYNYNMGLLTLAGSHGFGIFISSVFLSSKSVWIYWWNKIFCQINHGQSPYNIGRLSPATHRQALFVPVTAVINRWWTKDRLVIVETNSRDVFGQQQSHNSHLKANIDEVFISIE